MKGDAPGINGGDFDYQIEITPGNYTAENLVTAINDAFSAAVSVTTDVDFGNTNVSYNVNNQVTTLELFIAKHYDEKSYYLEFMNWETSLYAGFLLYSQSEKIGKQLGLLSNSYLGI